MPGNKIIATVGEILVEFVSHQRNCGLEQVVDYSGPYPSGAPAIFLDQAARMGARTEMYGGVGADGFGRSVLGRLRADGVGTDGVQVLDGRSTGVAFVSYYDSGARDFIFHLARTAADGFATPRLTDPANTLLHVSASSLGVATMRPQIMAAVHAVAQAGGWISCDPNARPELMRDPPAFDAMQEVMARSRILLPSTSDLGFLFPDLTEEAAIDRLLQASADIVAIKRGADGATVVSASERHDVPGHEVTELDPTGAGDCFGGTFVALLASGADLGHAARMANAAGALAVTRRGPMEGNSLPADLTAFLDQQSNRKTPS